jgi:dihydroorotate dehydrogenase
MPDWFYRTVSRPFLFQLEAETARCQVCGLMGLIGRLPAGLGAGLIDFLGHMRPDARLSFTVLDLEFKGPAGLGCRLDGRGEAAKAWSRFGFSFLELGPVSRTPEPGVGFAIEEETSSVSFSRLPTISPERLSANLAGIQLAPCRVLIRLNAEVAETPELTARDILQMTETLAERADLFSIDFGGAAAFPVWTPEEWDRFWDVLRAYPKWIPWLVVLEAGMLEFTTSPVVERADGILLEAVESFDGGFRVGPTNFVRLKEALMKLRKKTDENFPLIASGGIHQPADVREILNAGASLVLVDTGLMFSGPGLPKRINEAILHTLPEPPVIKPRPVVRQSWFWSGGMGLGMLIGSVMALWIALTRVVLPYDEVFCGITRVELAQINDRLLPFMSHDRVTLAGTMLAIGMLYLAFSWFGSRRGEHWAQIAVLASALVGFFSFFLFLGFGYFDPFHGFVTAILFQLFVHAIVGEMPPRSVGLSPEWRETREWRRGQWGQFLLILHSAGLLGAGLVIGAVGMGDVFVGTDLDFLGTDLATLTGANERLIPLVAHDRATLGGMLLASGIVYLLGSLWGLRRGNTWLWNVFCWSGIAAYTCAIGVHLHVGYVDGEHLLPAVAGFILLMSGLLLCRRWVFAAPEVN